MRYSKKELGPRIRQLRGSRTQEEFSRVHEISQGYLSDLERGKAIPSFKFLLSLHRKEDISLDWLISGQGSPIYLSPESETAPVRERAPEVYRKVDELLLVNPSLSPTLLEFLDLFFKLETNK